MLHLHRAERSDRLVAGLADLLRVPPADPFTPDVVAVPAKGVERWVAQRLSHVLGARDGGPADPGDGVCAAVRFPHPAVLVAEAVSTVTGVRPEDDPWSPGRLLWPLLQVIDAAVGEPWCRTLAGHLGADPHDAHHDVPRPGRRLDAAARLTRLLAAYGSARPQMLRDWAAGDDTDGFGAPLDDDLAWQAELWRRLRREVGAPSPAERLPEACDLLADDRQAVDLPDRLSLFGPTRLRPDALAVLTALAVRRDVHLWVPHPSPALWDAVQWALGTPAASGPPRRAGDPTRDAARHPLLASLGRDARELQVQLAAMAPDAVVEHQPSVAWPDTLLGRLQAALAADDPDPTRAALAEGDRSVQVHACHGPARQVEVLREVLVGLLADDPTLEPRDVLVMCPDIEDYAPLVSAFFGLDDDTPVTDAEPGRHHPGHRLRVRLADRSLRQTNPLLGVVGALLELADSRLPASALLDLASTAPVRARFGFDDDDVARLTGWLVDSGTRWGLDAGHRERVLGVPLAVGTWRAGLDRILLGVAMSEDELQVLGTALPLDDVDSGDVDLAGRLAELVERVGGLLERARGRLSLTQWLELLTDALDELTDVREQDAWQSAQARRELGDVAADAGERAAPVTMTVADLRVLLADLLRGRPTRANFRTGHLTMCSMVPMRSVPHRVVVLLGLDDGHFPRAAGVDGDDVLARAPVVGERDPRSEDRQLMLDAVLAAGEHLVVLHTGADPRTGARRPPAVPVGELLDALDLLTPEDAPARAGVVVQHPLQPVDRRNFVPARLGRPGPFSFDRSALDAARRATRPRAAHRPFAGPPLPPVTGEVSLDDLVAFLEHPVRAFLRQRLAVTLPRDEPELADALDLSLDPLQRWQVGDRLLRARLSGVPKQRCQAAEWRRGVLPPATFGKRLLEEVTDEVEAVVDVVAPLRAVGPESVDVAVDVGGCQVVGTVGGLRDGRLVAVDWASLAPKHRLGAWTRLLALSAARPGQGWTAATVGRSSKEGASVALLDAVDGDRARAVLAELVDLRARGLREPLPLPPKTAAAYAARRPAHTAPNALAYALREWKDDRGFPKEQSDAAVVEVWGPGQPLDRLLEQPPREDERGNGWPDDEPSRFGALARRLWTPLLAVERVERAEEALA